MIVFLTLGLSFLALQPLAEAAITSASSTLSTSPSSSLSTSARSTLSALTSSFLSTSAGSTLSTSTSSSPSTSARSTLSTTILRVGNTPDVTTVYNTASDTFTADPPDATSPPGPTTPSSNLYSLQWRSDPDSDRFTNCSALNGYLNALDSGVAWPSNFNISVAGQLIGAITAVVYGGDLCQTGGDYSFLDQEENEPPTYRGGSELVKIESLNLPGFQDLDSGATALKYTKYFGLGNHDVQSYFTPIIGWSKDGLQLSSPDDFWRYQMWNFITQMHTGPFDLIQFHHYGNDSEYSRQSGIVWLQQTLKAREPIRRIIIAQHYLFSETCDTGGICPSWTAAQRNTLLAVLAPYNIIVYLNSAPAARSTNMALIRVTPAIMDVVYGNSQSGGGFDWTAGMSFNLPFSNELWVKSPTNNANYFGSLKDIYVDTRVVHCAAGEFIFGVSLIRASDVTNRLSWQTTAGNARGSGLHNVTVSGENKDMYFPDKGGMSSIYVDESPVSVPSGSVVVGVFFWQKGNRIAPGIMVFNPETGTEQNITNVAFEDYFPPTGGSSGLYANTNLVNSPTDPNLPTGLVMGGVAFYQQKNQIALRVFLKYYVFHPLHPSVFNVLKHHTQRNQNGLLVDGFYPARSDEARVGIFAGICRGTA
ncbi:hypothetical protein B0H19DRAFT_1081404 [Mycena capillaripes]|nr:hypothetical protein B0H19DRAFT_1081152 [Mycena capillaripes]KAJ6533249.1 hypothetical protein B0H19DRAFT_1081404 [Mycena capillaripes]